MIGCDPEEITKAKATDLDRSIAFRGVLGRGRNDGLGCLEYRGCRRTRLRGPLGVQLCSKFLNRLFQTFDTPDQLIEFLCRDGAILLGQAMSSNPQGNQKC